MSRSGSKDRGALAVAMASAWRKLFQPALESPAISFGFVKSHCPIRRHWRKFGTLPRAMKCPHLHGAWQWRKYMDFSSPRALFGAANGDKMDLTKELESLEPELAKGLAQASSLDALEELRVEFLGRKGRLAKIMAQLPAVEPSMRPVIGETANRVKKNCNALFDERKKELEASMEADKLAAFDPSMPGRSLWQGSLHPTTLITGEICEVFGKLGFDIASGPEVELDRYNFEALNIPPDHPARDMQDTLYITGNILLRTHTSPVQARTMLARKPPIAVVAPGKVYRRDSDITHTPMFHQVEGLMVGKNISMADLRGILLEFIHEIFGSHVGMRFRPSFFPFTEPSAEVDISCVMCGGKGRVDGSPCRVCKTTGWVEILGCGMVDPAVYEAVGYPTDVSGFAFGLGVERIAMLKYGINDLRIFFQNDTRFLSQFGEGM